MDKVIINNKNLAATVSAIKKFGPDKLHVLADFDRTLTQTQTFVNGREVPSLISILRDHNYLTPDYPAKARALYQKYYPLENDPQLSIDQKRAAMAEWWREHIALLIKSGLTKKDIESAMSAGHIKLRPGAKEFFSLLKNNNLPLVIISSSGIGDYSISQFLRHEKYLTDNIHIISNRYQWDDNGRAIGIKQPIIHGMNKDETILKELPVYKQIKNRTNVILLGDSPSDTGMITGFNYDNLIKIGWLNSQIEERLNEYKKHFDVIILNDGPLDYANQLLADIID